MKLIPKNGEGENANQPLPSLTTQHFFDEKTAQLAVIFDVKNSPDVVFYPHFTAKNPEEILALRQDFLWENHCYELFMAFEKAENSPYMEINFSPSGEFNLYHFGSYRTPQQMPPRRLNVGENDRQSLLNVYQVSSEDLPIFWQNSLINHLNLSQLIAKNYPLSKDSHRLVMVIDMKFLAEILKLKTADNIWINPCAVYNGEQELAYFAHQHANPPDFHDKNYWLEVKFIDFPHFYQT